MKEDGGFEVALPPLRVVRRVKLRGHVAEWEVVKRVVKMRTRMMFIIIVMFMFMFMMMFYFLF